MIVEDQSEVIEFLSRPETHGKGVTAVERIDTHISIVFLAGERVYKLKRAVRFSYLDFSTRELRRRYCEAEVRVNRRTAPELYEGVAAVVRGDDGSLRLEERGGGARACDWLVVLRRFDEDTLFDRMAGRGDLSGDLMIDLAGVLARFHEEAERRFDFGAAESIRETLGESTERFLCHGGNIFDGAAVRRLLDLSWGAFERLCGLLEARREAGFVRHCHGDLHLRNICLVGGRPTLFDAIEFNESLACIDTLFDLAFLLMDLEHRGLRPLANLVLNRYVALAEAPEEAIRGLAALPLFLSCRAAIRAHTGAEGALSQRDEDEARRLVEEARAYFRAAEDFLATPAPRLIAVGGYSGSGKSRLAQGIAPQLGAAPGALVLRSDVIRKRLQGVDEFTRLGPESYASRVSERVFRTICARAALALEAGRSVIADAVYVSSAQRAALAAVAERAGVPFTGLWLEAPFEVMERRIAARPRDASDATVEVLRRQLGSRPGDLNWRRLDASRDSEAVLAAARAVLF